MCCTRWILRCVENFLKQTNKLTLYAQGHRPIHEEGSDPHPYWDGSSQTSCSTTLRIARMVASAWPFPNPPTCPMPSPSRRGALKPGSLLCDHFDP